MKRIFTLLFAAMLAGQAWAETTFTKNNLEYTVTDATNHYVSVGKAGTKPTGDLEIKDTVSYEGVIYTVTSIPSSGFYGCNKLTSITLPSTITSIGFESFYNCNQLTAFTIPSAVTSIGKYAFRACSSLTSINIPSGVSSIGENAFESCSGLTAFNVESDNAMYCSIDGVLFKKKNTYLTLMYYPTSKADTEYNLPDNVSSIENKAFYGCKFLASINVSNSNKDFYSDNGVLLDINKQKLIVYPSQKADTAYSIPNTVEIILHKAFYQCQNLKSLIIPTSVTDIDDYSIHNCTNLTINCCTASKPEEWLENWSYNVANVVWGYTPEETPGTKTWTVTLSASNSSYGSVSGGGTVKDGAKVTITATPVSGYKFVKWSNGLTNATETITVTSDLNLVAEFVEVPTWTVTLTSNNASYGSVSGGGTVEDGATTTIRATPASGYKFVKWSNGLTTATAIIKVTSDTTLVANFDEKAALVVGELAYEITSDSTAQVVKADDYKTMTEVVIPETVEIDGKTYTVTSIGRDAFEYCGKITTVSIPNTVVNISSDAFFNCDSLISMDIPNSVTHIGHGVFYGCDNLTSVNIPYSVISIDDQTFENCQKLIEINVASGNSQYSSADGVMFNKDKTELMYFPAGKTGEYSIPNTVTTIADEAFGYCHGLESVNIPNSVKIIKGDAFISTNLTTVTIPDGVKIIEHGAFGNCYLLKSATISNTVTKLSPTSFYGCYRLSRIDVASGNSNYTSDAGIVFNKDKTEIISFPAGKTDTSYTIPSSVTKIGDNAFYGCDYLKSITIPESVTSICYEAFENCESLTSIFIPNSVTSIGDYAFDDCYNLASIILPKSITHINRNVFDRCNKLVYNEFDSALYLGTTDNPYFALIKAQSTDITSCQIHDSCKVIAEGAFGDCENLQYNEYDSVLYLGSTENPYLMLVKAKSTDITSCKVGNGCRFIENSAFYKCNKLTSITIPNGVQSIGEFAFYGCEKLATITIPESVRSIGNYAFFNCESLTAIAIPDGVTFIDNNTFCNCRNLASVTIPNSITSISYWAFANCPITKINIPESVESIDQGAFIYCNKLNQIMIPNSVTTIGERAFSECNNLTIFCEAEAKPVGWNDDWNSSGRPVVWGCKAVKIETNDADLGNVTTNPVGGIAANDSLWFANGATVELTAKPLNGHFVKWENGGTAKSRTITIADGATYTATFEQHTIVVDSAVAATCTATGLTEGSHCSVCGEIIVAQTETPITEHTIVTDAAVAPTATTDGLTEGSHCSVCGEIIVAQEVIPALGEVSYYTYKIIGGSSVEITGYTGSRTDISIPSEIVDDGTTYTVTDIAREAFSKNGNLTSVTIPSSVTYIGDNAFEGCNNLSFVVIPNSVNHIGDGAFSECTSLESVTLPDAITYIPSAAFGGCTSLTAIEIPSTVEFIGNSAFSGSGLTSISIPNSVTEISSFAFQDCKGLSTIIIPESVEKIGNWTFKGCETLTIYCCASSIPDGWETYWNSDNRPYDLGNCSAGRRWTVTVSANNSVYGSVTGGGAIINGSTTTISATPASGYEFVRWSNGLTNATETITVISDTSIVAEFAKETLKPADSTSFSFNILSETAHTVEVSRYYGTGKAAAIPAKTVIDGVEYTVTSIGEDAFIYCRELTSVSIPNSVTNIEGFAFYGCTGLKSLTVPNSVTSIGWQAFDNVKNVIYTGNATGSPWYALAINGVVDGDFIYSDAERTNLVAYIGTNENVTIPNTVVSIGESAFEDSKIKTLTIPNTVTSISPNMCSDCDGLTSITIPNSVTNIGYRAFYCCSNLKSVTIPNSVEEIDDYAFYGCHSLTSVNLPNSVTDIGEESFAWCNNLMEINVDDGNNYYVSVDGVLFNKDKTTIVCCPAGRTGTYTIPNSVTTIGDAAFEFTKLSSVTIPSTVVDIEEDAFNGSDSLTYMNIPNSVTNIGVRAFYSCSNLASLTIPNSVASIDWYAFSYCSKLKSVACLATVPPVLDEDDPFVNTDTVYVLSDYVAAYKAADVWNKKTILPITVKSNDATSGVVYSGDNLLFAEPKEGYHFVSWGDNSVENPRKTTGTEASLTARFEAHIAVVDNAVAATCIATGLTEGSHCSVCGEIIVAQTETPMIEHTSVVDSAVAATCTESGMTEGSHCSACGVVIVKQKKVSPLGHKFVDYIYNNDATTAADGTETAVCEHGCGETDTRTAVGTKLTNTAVTETAANAVNIYAHGNTIVVENATDEICVYDAMGRLVCRDAARHVSMVAKSGVRAEIHVNTAGLYIVKVGNIAKRVMVN